MSNPIVILVVLSLLASAAPPLVSAGGSTPQLLIDVETQGGATPAFARFFEGFRQQLSGWWQREGQRSMQQSWSVVVKSYTLRHIDGRGVVIRLHKTGHTYLVRKLEPITDRTTIKEAEVSAGAVIEFLTFYARREQEHKERRKP